MRIVVIGGTGLIGSRLVTWLGEHGHEAVAAAPSTGVDTLTGEPAEVLAGAAAVVDVANSPSFEDTAVMEFFETSTRNLLAAAAAAGVGHHVALSVGGPERFRMDEFFSEVLALRDDPRVVITDPAARYFGVVPGERTLVPGDGATLGELRYRDWAGK